MSAAGSNPAPSAENLAERSVVTQQSVYRVARAHVVSVFGRFAVAAGVVVVVVVLTAALTDDLPDPVVGVLLVIVAVCLALSAVAAARVVRRPALLLLSDTGYRVRVLRRAGPTSAPWADVTRVRREQLAPGPCLVLSLTDGARTVVPVRLLEGGAVTADRLEADLRARLDKAHGQRRL